MTFKDSLKYRVLDVEKSSAYRNIFIDDDKTLSLVSTTFEILPISFLDRAIKDKVFHIQTIPIDDPHHEINRFTWNGGSPSRGKSVDSKIGVFAGKHEIENFFGTNERENTFVRLLTHELLHYRYDRGFFSGRKYQNIKKAILSDLETIPDPIPEFLNLNGDYYGQYKESKREKELVYNVYSAALMENAALIPNNILNSFVNLNNFIQNQVYADSEKEFNKIPEKNLNQIYRIPVTKVEIGKPY